MRVNAVPQPLSGGLAAMLRPCFATLAVCQNCFIMSLTNEPDNRRTLLCPQTRQEHGALSRLSNNPAPRLSPSTQPQLVDRLREASPNPKIHLQCNTKQHHSVSVSCHFPPVRSSQPDRPTFCPPSMADVLRAFFPFFSPSVSVEQLSTTE
jgi:hypothetical protein